MSNWTRAWINSTSTTKTNVYIDLEKVRLLKVVLDSTGITWTIAAEYADNDYDYLFGTFTTENDACDALRKLVTPGLV